MSRLLQRLLGALGRPSSPALTLDRAVAHACEPLELRVMLATGVSLIPGDARTGPASKIGPALTGLFAEYQDFKATRKLGTTFVASDPLIRTRANTVVVDVVADGDAAQLEANLRALNMQNVARVGRMISGLLPIDALDELAVLPALRFAQPAWAQTNAGSVLAQSDPSMRADIARTTWGVNGTGVTVGVLSDSFDTGPGSYAADIVSGDLPAGVNILQDLAGGTDEGRAMAQIIFDSAPGATLAFATAFTGQAGMANNITNLRTVAGADVITDDIIYFAEPMFQDGIIAQAVDATFSAGVPYFSSANNQGRRAYESNWRSGPVLASGSIPIAAGAPTFFGGTTFDFDPGAGVDNMQSLTLPAFTTIRLSFQWNQPFFSVSGGAGSANELDIYLLNAAGTQVLAGASSLNQGGDAVEVFAVTNTGGAPINLNLMLAWDQTLGGPAPGFIKYVDFGGAVFNQFVTNSGAAFGHTNAQGAASVGAAAFFNTPAFGVDPAVIESFSNAGPTLIRFTTTGAATNELRQTPDFVAPDNVNTTFFGSDVAQDADAFPNFAGTSAAAPAAAAVAALIRDLDFGATPAQIYDALEHSALDMDDPATAGFDVGVDFGTGYGLIQADRALRVITSGRSISGTVFQDNNSNAVMDGAETGMPGQTVFLDTNNNGAIDTATSNFTRIANAVISDNLTQSVSVNVSGLVGLLTDVNVTLNITHTWDSDLAILLVSPAGTRVQLVNNRGGSGDNFTGTILDDEAAVAIGVGAAPFAGTFRPETPLSALDGENGNGQWRLELTDSIAPDPGILANFTLTLTSGDLAVTTNASGNYAFTNIEPFNTVNVREIVPSGFIRTVPNPAWTIAVQPGVTYILFNHGNLPFSFAGTGGDDEYYVLRSGAEVHIWENVPTAPAPPPTYEAQLALLTNLIFSTGAGQDDLTIDFAGGNPNPPSGITFSGGSGADQLNVLGTANPDTISAAASFITVNGASDISPTSVEGILFDTGGDVDNVSVNSAAFGTIININTGAGADVINVGGGDLDTNVLFPAEVVVDGGIGANSLIVNDTSDGGGADTYFYHTDSLTKLDPGSLSWSNVATVTINGSPQPSIYNITGTATGVNLVINGNAGADTFNLTPQANINLNFEKMRHTDSPSFAPTFGATFSQNGFLLEAVASQFASFGMDNAKFTGSTGIFNNNIGGVTRLTQKDGNPFTLQSIDLAELNGNQAPGAFISFTGTTVGGGIVNQTFQLDGAAFGAQTFNFNASFTNLVKVEWDQISPFHQFDNIRVVYGQRTNALDGPITLNGGNGADAVTANDSANTADESHQISSYQSGSSALVIWGAIESFVLQAGSGNDTINVNQATVPVTLNGNGGADTFNVGSPGNNVEIIDAPVQVNGGGGSDVMNYNDQANGFGDNYTITSSSVTRFASSVVNYATIEALVVNASTAGNPISILSSAAGTPITVNGGNGDDTFFVADGDWDLNLGAPLTLNGQGGTLDTVRITDTADLGADGYTVAGSVSNKTGGQAINYATVEALIIEANNDANAITVTGTPSGNVTILGNGGADTIDVVGNFLGTLITVDGGTGLDTIQVNSDASGIAGVQFTNSQDLAALRVFQGGTVRLNSGGNRVIYTQLVDVTGTGVLDLTNNDMIVDYAGASPLAGIRADLTTGYAGNAWNGAGINSSVAAANAAKTTALGYAEASDVLGAGGGVFSGIAVDGTAVLVKYTWYGDGDLSGAVDITDLGRLATNWQQSPRNWSQGNFDYDAVSIVDITDLGLLATNWQAGVGSPLSPSLDSALRQLGRTDLIAPLRRSLFSERVIDTVEVVELA